MLGLPILELVISVLLAKVLTLVKPGDGRSEGLASLADLIALLRIWQ